MIGRNLLERGRGISCNSFIVSSRQFKTITFVVSGCEVLTEVCLLPGVMKLQLCLLLLRTRKDQPDQTHTRFNESNSRLLAHHHAAVSDLDVPEF